MGSFEKIWGTSIEFAVRFPIELIGGVIFGILVGLPSQILLRETTMHPLLRSFVIGVFLFSFMLLLEWASARKTLWLIAAIVKSASVGGLCFLSGMTVTTLMNRSD